jgi:hypothetical protein
MISDPRLTYGHGLAIPLMQLPVELQADHRAPMIPSLILLNPVSIQTRGYYTYIVFMLGLANLLAL